MLTNLTNTLTTLITHLYATTGLAGILLAMAIESCCIPLPSEIVMPLAGAMVATILPGANPLVGLILIAAAGAIGCLIGSMVAYGIGYAGGRPLLLKYGRYVLISQHDADKADRFFQRWGSATTFFSRLLPVVRTYISLPAGIAKMPFVKFCIYTVLGSFPWCFILAFIGYNLRNLFGNPNSQNPLSSVFHGLDIVILVLFVLLVALYIWRHIRNDRKARAALAASEAAAVAQASQQNSWMQPPSQQSQPWNQGQGQGYQGQQGYPQQTQQQWKQEQFPPQQPWGQPQQPQQPFQPQSSQPSPWNQNQQQSWGQPQPPQSPQPQPQPWNQAQNQFPPQQPWGQPLQPQQPWPSQDGDNDPSVRRR